MGQVETHSGIHNLYILNDQREQEYSSESDNCSESDSNSGNTEEM
jgi:hypothetical protein